MTFVILQPCCNDASCADVCPVDCIHPTPDEPEFMRAEMLHIDPDTCIDCGACVDECPVDAIRADHEIDAEQDVYLEINADYFRAHPIRSTEYTNPTPTWKNTDFTGRRIAVVGSGPAAFYAAIELTTVPGIEIDIYDRLLTPYGLVRAGVAPDHPETKAVTELFRAVARTKSVHVHLGVEIGTDVTHEDLMAHHDAVVYATGASGERTLDIPGEELPGSHAATEFVAWYNGHPDFADRTFDFSSRRAVVIGNGNVALDLARILTADPEELAHTDIADHALDALRHSNIREVLVLGRRGPAQAKFTNPELIALSNSTAVDLVAHPLDGDTAAAMESEVNSSNADLSVKLALVQRLTDRYNASAEPDRESAKKIVLRFCTSPVSIEGTTSVSGIRLVHNVLRAGEDGSFSAEATGDAETVDTSLVLRSVGYRGRAITGVPFDATRGVVPNADGRVIDESGRVVPGVYVAGWIKRGPTGVIGTNRKCARETVHRLLEDIASGSIRHTPRGREELDAMLSQKAPDALDFTDWLAIDAAEIAAGTTSSRPRIKFVDQDAMRSVALRHRSERY